MTDDGPDQCADHGEYDCLLCLPSRKQQLAPSVRLPWHPFLTNDYGSVPDTFDGRTSFATCWDMVWIKDESMGQEITVWWQQAPRVAMYLIVGYFRCLWLQGVRKRRAA